jgi:16S rRNA (guanine527-N7)-methyltransferase
VTRAGAAQLWSRLHAGLDALSLELPAGGQERLLDYLAELQKWNAAYNLTAVRDPLDMVTRHLLDSLAVLPRVSRLPSPVSRLCDAGTGAGLPGIPLAIARPHWHVSLLDSNGKKARFLRHVQRTLALDNVEVIEARAELHRPEMPYDVVISRAFASLGDFLRLTAHLAGDHGHWLAMKGKLAGLELSELPEGFQVNEVIALSVPGLDEARHLVHVSRLPSPVSRQ